MSIISNIKMKESKSMTTTKKINRRQPVTWAQLRFDVDAYLARGGRLMDVVLPTSALDRRMEEMRIEALTPGMTGEEQEVMGQRIGRVGRFLQRVGEQQGQSKSTTVGSVLTEEDLRRIWRETV
jgi:hypothetical protein